MKQTFTLLFYWGIMMMPTLLWSQLSWSEDFSSGLPADWTNEDESGQNVLWAHCANVNSCNFENSPISDFHSATVDNGFAMLNSAAFGELSTPHISRITSAPIDCDGYSQAFLQFQTAIATASYNPAEYARVYIIGDEGQNMLELTPFPVLSEDNELQYAPVNNILPGSPFFVTLDISNLVQVSETIRIRWEWVGNYEFFWVIDDVVVSEQNPARPDNALWFSSFNFGAEGWTSNVVSGPDSTWKWVPGGDVSPAFTVSGVDVAPEPFAFMHSQTAANGAMVFNADFYNTMGVAPPEPFIPDYFVCDLISPVINLSGNQKPVAIQFSQLARLGNLAADAPSTPEGARFITSISYSVDGGETWSPPYNTTPYTTPATAVQFFPFEHNTFYLPIPKEAANSEMFRVKLTWGGDVFFWAIDDVAIVNRPEWDMKVNRNFMAMLPNLVTPSSQVSEIPFLADIVNNGSEAAQEVVEKAIVIRASNQEIIYQDSLSFETAPVDTLIENVLFESLLDPEDISQEGRYEGYYTVQHSMPDGRPQNDSLSWWFDISDTTFAKENGYTRDIAPNNKINYSYGNIFYVPNGEGWYARHITFGVNLALQLQEFDRTIEIRLYKWSGDLNGDGVANGDTELEELALNAFAFENAGLTEVVTVPVNFDGGGIPLEDDTYYIAAIRYTYNDWPPMYTLVNDTLDYQATVFANEELGQPQYASALDIGNTGNFSTLGFGYNIIPLVRLHISDQINEAREVMIKSQKLKVFPNPSPVGAVVTIETPSQVAGGHLMISDMSGKNVFDKILNQVPEKRFTFDAQNLAPGSYTVRIQTKKYLATAKLIIQE